MNDSEKYGLGKRYKEVKITQENLYDFLKSVDLDHFCFDVFHKEPHDFLICGLVYKDCNDVETFKKHLMKYKKSDIWKVFKFHSKICECDVFRVILEE
jgi:hypothetical protein